VSEPKKRVFVFAGGEPEYGHGASGLKMMLLNTKTTPVGLDAEIVGAASYYEFGGTRQKCDDFKIPFEFRPSGFTSEWYASIMKKYKVDFAMFSGWLKYAKGIDFAKAINIHCGLLPMTKGLHGDNVHCRALEMYHAGKTVNSGVTMHFVTWREHDPEKKEYDAGPIICQRPVPIMPNDTLETLKARVNAMEHAIQSMILDLVVHGRIFYHEGKTQVNDFQLKRFLGI